MVSSPGQIVKLRLLSQVPVSEYSDLAPPENPMSEKDRLSFFRMLRTSKPAQETAKKVAPKVVELNAAAWLSFANALVKPVSLWLNVEDEKGVRSFLVDEQSVGDSLNTMLSGSVRFKSRGHVKSVSACCGGIANEDIFKVDELYVKRNRDVSALDIRHHNIAV